VVVAAETEPRISSASPSLTRLSVARARPSERRSAPLSSTFHPRLLGLLSGGAIIERVSPFAALAAPVALSLVVVSGWAAPGGRAARDDKYGAWLVYARCMRSHGVPGFPDPTQVGSSIQIGSARGIDARSPFYVSAQRSCRRLLPGGSLVADPAHRQQELARMLRISRCMRAHRISGFPDPTPSPPASRAGYGVVRSDGYAWLAIPGSIDVRSAAFERAADECNLGLS
jgi:hypothetical protein